MKPDGSASPAAAHTEDGSPMVPILMTSVGAVTALGLFAGFMVWWRRHKASHDLIHPES
jgi:uncharacterized iron-regulated membrane protein